jgi:hypothetical protein
MSSAKEREGNFAIARALKEALSIELSFSERGCGGKQERVFIGGPAVRRAKEALVSDGRSPAFDR